MTPCAYPGELTWWTAWPTALAPPRNLQQPPPFAVAEAERRKQGALAAETLERRPRTKPEEALNVMSQRFKRVKAQDSGELKGHVAIRLELILEPRVTALSLEEREEVTELDRRWQKYRAGR